jgi:hypothetical protein
MLIISIEVLIRTGEWGDGKIRNDLEESQEGRSI